MCKKLVFVVSLVVLLSMAGSVSAKLILHWRFDEGSGTIVRDSSGNGRDGVFEGNPTWVAGKIGGALDFAGAGERVVDADAGDYLNGLDAVTVAIWIKSRETNSDRGFIIGEEPDGGDNLLEMRYDAAGATAGGSNVLKMAVVAPSDEQQLESSVNLQTTEWQHVTMVWSRNEQLAFYVDGELDTPTANGAPRDVPTGDITMLIVGQGGKDAGRSWNGLIDDVRIYDTALTVEEIQAAMAGEAYPYALGPVPEDGAMHADTWVNISWSAGDFAVSHDVYLSDSYDDVSGGAEAAFQGNQIDTFLVVGFPGFAFPDGLLPGATYYWRIDEVNDADPNSPWVGPVWSFSVPPKTAYFPDPIDGAQFVELDATLAWTPGFGAKLHTVYLGDSFEDVNNATGGAPQGAAAFAPATPLDPEKVYYWRVDEFDPPFTHKGDIWSFTTPGAVGNPQPADGAVDVQIIETLAWTPADTATSSDLYFGTDADAVENATAASPEYVGNKALGAESHDPGKLVLSADYYWRVDAVYPAETVKGLLWSFTAADFLLVDDFEAYNDVDPPDPNSNIIFNTWIDGFGTTTNGALVGNDLPPYAELNDVHGGGQAMPYFFDNNLKTSEATLTLVWPRDFTEGGMTKLSLWFKGDSDNAAERMFVALNGTAVVYHDDSAVTQIGRWTEWTIELAAFAGVDLSNVNTITIGFGTKNSPAAGGAGNMLFDDIRLIP